VATRGRGPPESKSKVQHFAFRRDPVQSVIAKMNSPRSLHRAALGRVASTLRQNIAVDSAG